MAILEEFESVIDNWLGLSDQVIGRAPQYQHRATLLRLSKSEGKFAEENLLSELLQAIQQAQSDQPGARHFEFRQVTTLDENSSSREVTLERSLIRAVVEAQRKDLGNMMSVASGAFEIQANTRTAIDLVQRQNERLSLIELKVDSNTPLSAAMQILCYAACYVAARSAPKKFGCNGTSTVLTAAQVTLNVLAPYNYYHASYQSNVIRWLQAFSARLNHDLKEIKLPLGKGDRGYTLSFEFQHFPKEFSWEAANANNPNQCRYALAAFDQRQILSNS